jgi:hypothetical protein
MRKKNSRFLIVRRWVVVVSILAWAVFAGLGKPEVRIFPHDPPELHLMLPIEGPEWEPGYFRFHDDLYIVLPASPDIMVEPFLPDPLEPRPASEDKKPERPTADGEGESADELSVTVRALLAVGLAFSVVFLLERLLVRFAGRSRPRGSSRKWAKSGGLSAAP